MTKILNLDELGEKIAKSIVYKGEKHDFAPMSVSDFIDMVRAAEEKEKATTDDEAGMADKFSFIRESVGKAFPTLAEHLELMAIGQLLAIFEFLQRTADDDLDKATEAYKAEAAEGNVEEAGVTVS